MYHFFVHPEQIGEKEIKIVGSDVNHIKNVLRMAKGEQITVSNGQDEMEYRCEISDLCEDFILAEIMWAQEADTELPTKVYLFQGLPKNDKMEFIIQKTIELGVFEIIPVATKRAVVKLDAKKEATKQKRWTQIAESAAKQSKRRLIPKICSVMSWKEAIAYASSLDVRLIPYELAKGMDETREQINKIKPGQRVGIFIGPEGGFDEQEIKMAKEAGIEPITLGRRILRTETAGMAVMALLMFQLEQ